MSNERAPEPQQGKVRVNLFNNIDERLRTTYPSLRESVNSKVAVEFDADGPVYLLKDQPVVDINGRPLDVHLLLQAFRHGHIKYRVIDVDAFEQCHTPKKF